MDKKQSIIISVCDDRPAFERALQSCRQLSPYEIIVVAHPACEQSIKAAAKYACRVIPCHDLETHKGHALGAKEATGDILLFVPSDVAITAGTLKKFLQPLIEGTADVAINKMDYWFYKKGQPQEAVVFPQMTNQFFRRPDLKMDSTVFVPYAMTKEVVDKIHADNLAHPVIAYFKMIQYSFRIVNQLPIGDVSMYLKKMAETNGPARSISEKRMIDYHLEAISYWIKQSGDPRGGHFDGGRRRDIVEGLKSHGVRTGPNIIPGWGHQPEKDEENRLSIIIPAQNEAKVIGFIIEECRKLEPFEIIVVANGSTDKTEKVARQHGATVIVYKQKLGHDVGRAVGAYFASGDILLFMDGDFVIPAVDLFPFVHAVERGVDVALNDLNHYLTSRTPLHIVTACKYAINVACGRKDLGAGSTVAVPHALSKKCVEQIGFEALATPVYAQIQAILNGHIVQNVHRIEVDKMNRTRPSQHFSKKKGELAPTTSLIIGDHIEAFFHLANHCQKSSS